MTVRIAAALCWFDEPAARLYQCVKTAGRLADVIVAVDGPYAQYPHTRCVSPDVQHQAVADGAHDAGVELVCDAREEPWTGQVAKRDHAIRSAAASADWVFPLDADETIAECDGTAVRAELAALDPDVAAVSVARFTPANGDRRPNSQPGEIANGTQTYPRLLRALPGLHVEREHWHYVADGPVTLWGPHAPYPMARSHTLQARLVFHHHQLFRDPSERDRQREYRTAVAREVALDGGIER